MGNASSDGALALLAVREDTLLQQELWLEAAEAAVNSHLLPLGSEIQTSLQHLEQLQLSGAHT